MSRRPSALALIHLAHPSHPLLAALALLALLLGLSGGAWAEPNIMITPTEVEQGGIVLLQIRDYRPGGYEASIRFDEVEIATWPIPIGGDGDVFIQIPVTASWGGHDLRVCAACDQGDLEQTATTRVTVLAGALEPGEFNVQIQAMEVTQGVRGPIPVRAPPLGDSTLPPDVGTHVANRRTVLRVYPWMAVGEGAPLTRFVVADLIVRRGTELYGPYRSSGLAAADKTLEEMRGNPSYSLEFTLADELVELSSLDTSLELDFSCDITNVPGETDGSDNLAELFGVRFEHVGMNSSFALRFRPFLVQHTFEEEGTEIQSNADINDLLTVLSDFQDVLPIADGIRGVRLYPWRFIDWEGPFAIDDVEVFDEEMIRTYLPTGRLDGNPQNDYYGFLTKQRGTRCGGHAYADTPYFIVGACTRPLFAPIPAHELTHAIWQQHAGNGHGEAAGGGFDPSYPGMHGQVESNTFGFNVYNGVAFPPESSTIPENQRHCYMSYGPDQWISQYTWEGTAADLGSPSIHAKQGHRVDSLDAALLQRQQKQDSYRLFTGSVDPSGGTVEVSPVFSVIFPPSPQQPQGTDILISFYDANQNLLSEHWTDVFIPLDTEKSRALLSDAVLVPDDWVTLVVGDGQVPFDTLQRSANPPTVSKFNLQDGFQWGPAKQGPVDLTWEGFDPDGDPLTYRVLGLREGSELNVLGSDLSDTSLTIDPAAVPGGGNWEIIVEASDGFDSGYSIAVAGYIDPIPPTPLITSPKEGQVILATKPLVATALYADFQGDTPQAPMQWSLDGNPVGQGSNITLQQLSLGQHTLEVLAINDFQLQGTHSVAFEVIDTTNPPQLVSPPDGSTDEARPPTLDWDPVLGAGGYQLQIALDPNFTQLIVDDASILDTEFSFLAAYPAVNYHWRAAGLVDGESTAWSTTWTFATDGWPVSNDPIASRVALNLRVFPNPFNPSTSISFSMVHGGPVELTIYDLAGRRVRALIRETRSEGEHTVRWNGRDDSGRTVSSGVYLARIEALGMEDSQRLVLLK